MRSSIRLTTLLIVALIAMLVSPSSMADSGGYWTAVYSFELPAGYWSAGTHTYQFQWEWTVPEPASSTGPDVTFTVLDEAPLYTGSALLRPWAVKALALGSGPSTCIEVDAIHPDQPTRFLVGWVNDVPMTRSEAQAHIDSMVARVTWDGGAPVQLTLVQFPAPQFLAQECSWALRSSSSTARPARSWGGLYSFELPAGSWSIGEHTYHFEFSWTAPEPASSTSPDVTFTVSDEAPLYTGSALVRPWAVKALAPGSGPSTCIEVDAINPDQPTRLLVGWLLDEPMTHAQALAHFDSLVVRVVWDGGSAELTRVQFPFQSHPDWDCVWALHD